MQQLLLAGILLFLLVTFVRERLPADVSALIGLALLLVFGLVTPEQATAGFSNPAVITVAAMFVLSEGLVHSGAVGKLGAALLRVGGGVERRAHAALLTATSAISAFINNTAAVAIFLPVSLDVAKHYRGSPSRLLIPLSYAAIFGGSCTLIGTSTNILVSNLAAGSGLPPFGMFELLPVGAVLLVAGTAYNLWLAPRLLPRRESTTSLTSKYRMESYLTELRVAPGSAMVGKTALSEELSERFRVNVLEILRGSRRIATDLRYTEIETDDTLIVRGSMEDILTFREQARLKLLTDVKLDDAELADENTVLTELQLLPGSDLIGATLREIDFRKRFSCFVLALARTGEVVRDKITSVPLAAWDTLLVFGPRQRVEGLAGSPDFAALQEIPTRLHRPRRWWIGLATIPAVVFVATAGWMPILESALLGAVVLLASRFLRIQQAYRAIDWSVIFLLAALIPVGTAMESTGLARRIGEAIVGLGGQGGPWVVLSLLVLATSLLTEVISNNSAAVLMVPIALAVAGQLGVDPRPFLMGVTFAASMSFATPTGYQTNTMVYGPGGYRYGDYLRVGVPLNLLFWGLTSLLVPLVWPF